MWSIIHNAVSAMRAGNSPNSMPKNWVHVHDREVGGEIFRGVRVRGGGAQFADDLDLQGAQLAVGDDEEVAAAARRVQEAQRAEFVLEALQRGAAVRVLARPQPLELGAQVVQEQRLDDLQDVLLGGVVGARGAAGRGLHDGLEQRAEDGGRDGGPVEAARVEQRLAHGRVEVGNAQRAAEQGAVDVREARQIFVERPLAAVLRRVEHLEQPRQPRPQVRAVLARAGFQQVEEDVARLEDAGVVREQAEDGAHQEPLQVVAGVAGGFQRVVQAAHAFGRAHVDRVLIPEGAPLHAQDEAEIFDVAGQVGQGEARFAALVAVEQREGLKVAQELVARPVAFGQRVEIRTGLFACGVQAAAGALLFDQQHAGPEQVDPAGGVVEPLDVLLVARDGAPPHPEDLEELVIEALRLALLAGGVPPPLGERRGAGAHLVPRQSHQVGSSLRG